MQAIMRNSGNVLMNESDSVSLPSLRNLDFGAMIDFDNFRNVRQQNRPRFQQQERAREISNAMAPLSPAAVASRVTLP